MERVVRWRGLEDGGLEHLFLHVERIQAVAEALVIGGSSGAPFGLHYHVVCDGAWLVREARANTGSWWSIRACSGAWSDRASSQYSVSSQLNVLGARSERTVLGRGSLRRTNSS